MITVELANQQTVIDVDSASLRKAVATVLQGEGVGEAEVSLAVVDDAAIRPLNQRYLQHDYATDVLSFLLDREESSLEGEVIVSAETAARQAPRYGWSPEQELLLYAIHGTLHLVGYDDHDAEQKRAMKTKEREYLAQLGIASEGGP